MQTRMQHCTYVLYLISLSCMRMYVEVFKGTVERRLSELIGTSDSSDNRT
jgi:hypothetical protein